MNHAALMAVASSLLLSVIGAQRAHAADTDEPAEDIKEVLITGSRLITNGNASPTPVTVVQVADLNAVTPSNVPDALNKLPIFSVSRNQATINNASSNNTGNFLNLRGFGIIRTLILFDGHRVPATAADGTIDTNTLPQGLMQRVDVVTGGASAVYGSDAVTGVVNFILDKKFQGLRGDMQYGRSTRGDTPSWKATLTGGTSLFGGRSHVEFSYEHYDNDGIDDKFDRPAGPLVYSEEGAGTAANPFHLVPNTRSATSSFGGLIRTGPQADREFASNGVLTPFVHGAPSGSTGIESGGNGTYSAKSSLLAFLTTDQGFGRVGYDITDNVTAYVQAGVSRAKTGNNFSVTGLNNLTFSTTNAFLTPAVVAATSAGGATTFTFSRALGNADPIGIDSSTRTDNITAGLEGKVGRYSWEALYTKGESVTRITNVHNTNTARLAAALDAVTSNGQVVCSVTVTNPGLYPGCVPLNLFGPTAWSQAALDYVRGDTHLKLTNEMDDFAASIHGDLFDGWAGPIGVALSGEYRKLTLTNRSDAQPTAHPNCTGLRFNCTANSTLWTGNVVADEDAAENIREIALELNAPLLADKPFVKTFAFNGAVRYADYSVSGNATTWKLGLDWHLTDDLSIRGTRSQDIRAPTLNDLFAPINASPTGFTDTHTNTSGVVTTQSQGNLALVPEVAQTRTLGVVYQPSWLRNFSMSVDYYTIEISNAIATVGGNNASTLAQCELSNGTSPLCALYVRPLPFSDRSPANYPTRILTQSLNIAATSTHGIDTEMNYRFNLGDMSEKLRGMVDLRLLASHQPKLLSMQFPGAVVTNAAGAAGLPSWKVNFIGRYSAGGFTFSLLERWRNAEKQSGNPTLFYSDPKVPAVAFTDVNFSYKWRLGQRDLDTFLSIQNAFDKKAPVYISTAFASSPGFFYPAVNGDDIVGRYLTAGIKLRF